MADNALEKNVFEQRFARLNRIFVPLYLLIGVVAAVYYGLNGDGYHFWSALGTLLIPVAVELFYRLARLERVQQLSFLVLAFSFLGYTLGTVLELYRRFVWFDKFVHMLSGVFVSVLCFTLFLAVRPGHRVRREDGLLALLFVFFGSMAVAGLWEVSEYFVHAVTGRDVQNVAATGVNDTMQDMIVCLIGTAAYLIPLARLYWSGRRGLFTNAAEVFVEKNGARFGMRDDL